MTTFDSPEQLNLEPLTFILIIFFQVFGPLVLWSSTVNLYFSFWETWKIPLWHFQSRWHNIGHQILCHSNKLHIILFSRFTMTVSARKPWHVPDLVIVEQDNLLQWQSVQIQGRDPGFPINPWYFHALVIVILIINVSWARSSFTMPVSAREPKWGWRGRH